MIQNVIATRKEFELKIIEIDTQRYVGMKCPETNLLIDFEETCPDDMEGSFVKGLLIPDVPDSMMGCDDSMFTAWESYYESLSEEEDWCLVEILGSWKSNEFIALEVTTRGMACGPVINTAYYIISATYESNLDSILLLSD